MPHQTEGAVERKLHYLAVVSVLTLPDICSAMESHNGSAHSKLYESWFDKWKLRDYDSFLTGHDLYRLRCGGLHQGRFGPPGMQYDRIVFMIEGAMHLVVSANSGGVKESVLQLGATEFCRDMTQSVRVWYEAKKDDANVKKHLPLVLQFRPQGLPPHFVNIPLIA